MWVRCNEGSATGRSLKGGLEVRGEGWVGGGGVGVNLPTVVPDLVDMLCGDDVVCCGQWV